ncbi:MAG: hypothetical protein ABSB42_16555 [Tepidisphaeraceae bacterium]|jgi:hypothetical protein
MSTSTAHHFVVEPFEGVGPIKFGMHKNDVSHAFSYVYRSFFKGNKSKVRSDHCENVGLIIHYDDESRVEYIELTKPEYGTVTVELFGQDITGISVRGLVKLLGSHTTRIEKNVYGYKFPDLGLNTFNSVLQSEDEVVECLGVGRRGGSATA